MAPKSKTCFVIMPIGNQEFGDVKLTADDLKRHYDDLIKEAILKADPSLEVTRADEVSSPGSITTEILTRIMHSDLVVADVTYPNPNVFYELGLRHACRVGTVIIRDKNGPKIPFDVAHLRHIEYTSTVTGLKSLAKGLKNFFDHFENNPDIPDNQLLELAKFTNYSFLRFGEMNKHDEELARILKGFMQSQELQYLGARIINGESLTLENILSTIKAIPKIIPGCEDIDEAKILEASKMTKAISDNEIQPKTTYTKPE